MRAARTLFYDVDYFITRLAFVHLDQHTTLFLFLNRICQPINLSIDSGCSGPIALCHTLYHLPLTLDTDDGYSQNVCHKTRI
jgi:hypothetical protein